MVADDTDQAARLAELGRIAGELLHDMTNALAALDARIDLTRAEAEAGLPVGAGLERIRAESDHLRQMVRDAFEYVRGREPGPHQHFDVSDAARDVVDRWLPLAPPLRVRLDVRTRERMMVAGQRSFFERALLNLLKNAGQHARGEVAITVAAGGGGGWPGVLVGVEDDGPGVSEADEHAVFQPFRHGGHGGTGLGLSFVAWAANELHGSVRCEPHGALGGARFEVWIPVREPPAAPRRAAVEPAAGTAGARIAIVDDMAELRALYTKLIARAGWQPVGLEPADFGDEAALAGAIDAARPDVVLLDLHLGELHGAAVWQALRERAPAAAARVLFLTGDDPEDVPRREADWPEVVSKLMPWPELSVLIARRLRGEPADARPG